MPEPSAGRTEPQLRDTITIDYTVTITGAFGESFAKPIDVSGAPAVRTALADAVRDLTATAVAEYVQRLGDVRPVVRGPEDRHHASGTRDVPGEGRDPEVQRTPRSEGEPVL
jgi:hypothetical protein